MPKAWIKYQKDQIIDELVEARATIKAIRVIPFYKDWANKLQQLELRSEIAGTTKVEGATFTDREFDQALSETIEQLETRSQRQARAIMNTYQWISSLADNVPITADLILDIHRRIITGADDDHCTPGQVRSRDEVVTFGQPRRRGAPGGSVCMSELVSFVNSIINEFPNHDPLIQALAVHYHIGAIHPFSDGNGRTARAFEALMLQRAGLRDVAFISMSNYYYEERVNYLRVLGEVREHDNDLTAFLKFGLKGVTQQSQRILNEIKPNLQKALFRNLMHDFFGRLRSTRRRLMAGRQLAILETLLNEGRLDFKELAKRNDQHYQKLKAPFKAYMRDLASLIDLKAIGYRKEENDSLKFWVRLEWPTEIAEGDFFKLLKTLPKAKSLF